MTVARRLSTIVLALVFLSSIAITSAVAADREKKPAAKKPAAKPSKGEAVKLPQFTGEFLDEPTASPGKLCLWYTRPAKDLDRGPAGRQRPDGGDGFRRRDDRADPVQRAYRLDRPTARLRPRGRGQVPARNPPPAARGPRGRTRGPQARSRSEVPRGPRENVARSGEAEGGRRPGRQGVHERAAAPEGLSALRRFVAGVPRGNGCFGLSALARSRQATSSHRISNRGCHVHTCMSLPRIPTT